MRIVEYGRDGLNIMRTRRRAIAPRRPKASLSLTISLALARARLFLALVVGEVPGHRKEQ